MDRSEDIRSKEEFILNYNLNKEFQIMLLNNSLDEMLKAV
jgi:hypothetical protein